MPFSFPVRRRQGPRKPRQARRPRCGPCPSGQRLRITFPRLLGYRYEMPTERLTATFTRVRRSWPSPRDDVPTKTEIDPIVGEIAIHDLAARRAAPPDRRLPVAKLTLENYFRDDGRGRQAVALPASSCAIAKRWLDECVTPS